MPPPPTSSRGALILSLDFELRWGVRDHVPPGHPYEAHLRGVWEAVPALLELFAAYDVAATWATVGFLFAHSEHERQRYDPVVRPAYVDRRLDPYVETGTDAPGRADLHYAPALIERIAATPRQELASHTYSHFYCTAPGATAEAFAADLRAAQALSSARGHTLRTIVFPRNQHNPAFDSLLAEAGITCYRGAAASWAWRSQSRAARVGRLAETYIGNPLANAYAWQDLACSAPPVNLPASQFVRPPSRALRVAEPVRVGLLQRRVRAAGRTGRVLHLWWHPHNMGLRPHVHIDAFRRVLDAFAEARDRDGMQSLTMAEAAAVCLSIPTAS